MRPGQNKRMRGRNNNNNNGSSNRKGPNPLTRSYESNGPDVKIRGTAHHIGEKYLQLARDAQSSGDPVMAESYLQHAEHYFRLIASAQQAQQQAAYGYQRPAGEQAEADDEDGDDDFSALPDRFASPAERVVAPPQPAPQPYAERPSYNGGGERQPYEPRQDRNDRYERPAQDRQNQQPSDRPYQDRQFQPDRRPERYDNRQDRNNGPDRTGQDRTGQDRTGQDRTGQDRNGQDRNGQDRNVQDRGAQPRTDRPSYAERAFGDRNPDRVAPEQDRVAPTRDFDNRGPRNNRGPREFRNDAGAPRDSQPSREPRQPDVEPVVNALPAFITTPVRIQPDVAPAPEPLLPGVNRRAPLGARSRQRRWRFRDASAPPPPHQGGVHGLRRRCRPNHRARSRRRLTPPSSPGRACSAAPRHNPWPGALNVRPSSSYIRDGRHKGPFTGSFLRVFRGEMTRTAASGRMRVQED